ncbi:leucine-rich repeat extensin-like protein 3 [Quercus suber]|uniref:leucine-rich repeat extensin-like protein 3 n=1 Tax=Quercus suber TaxID=58331 RepID=UPI0032DF6237
MPEFPPPPHASLAPEFPPGPHASPSPDIPPRTAYAVPDLEIPLPTAHASSHPEIPSHTPRTFFDPTHLSFTPPSFDLDYDFSQPPPIMHTQSPSYSIGHIDHVPPHSHSMSFMPTPRLHIDPMTTGLTHTSSATLSSPAVVGSSVVGSQANMLDVHVETEQVVVGLQSPPQGRPKRTTKAPPCGIGGHKAGHTRLAPRNARSLTKEMQYPLPHLPNIIRDNINVKCIRMSTPSASNAKAVAQETLSLTTTVRIYGTERKELGRISCNLVTQQHGFGIWLQGF